MVGNSRACTDCPRRSSPDALKHLYNLHRFIEMQAFLAELIEAFQFDLPREKMEIQRGVVGTGMVPMVRGKPELGATLPLRISLAL